MNLQINVGSKAPRIEVGKFAPRIEVGSKVFRRKVKDIKNKFHLNRDQRKGNIS